MVALTNERRVFMWRVRPKPVPELEAVENNVKVTLDEIIKLLETEFGGGGTANKARAYLSDLGRLLDDEDDKNRDEKNQIFIADIKRDKKHKTVTILMNRGDPRAVSPSLINAQKNAVRTIKPGKEEAPGFSAHLVIHMVEDKGKHRATFEKMSGLSSQLVIAAIDRFLQRAAEKNPKYVFDAMVKTKGKIGTKRKHYRPVLEVHRVPSENLEHDLERGELSSIILTKRKISYDGTGPKELIRRQEEKLVFTTAPATKGKVMTLVKGVQNWAKKHDYESISFHLDKLEGNQSSRPTLLLNDDQDAHEQLYVRAQIIAGFGDLLEGCYAAICPEIEEKMIAIVTDDW